MLTPNEALVYLEEGQLPLDFDQRLRYAAYEAVEEVCSNCDDARDMNMVLRDWWHDNGPSWCPFCCDDQGQSAKERHRPGLE